MLQTRMLRTPSTRTRPTLPTSRCSLALPATRPAPVLCAFMTQSIWRNQKVVAMKLLVVAEIPQGAQRLGYSSISAPDFAIAPDNRAGDFVSSGYCNHAIAEDDRHNIRFAQLNPRAPRRQRRGCAPRRIAIAGLSLLAAIRPPAQSPVTKLCRNGRYEVPIFEGSKRRVRRYLLFIFVCADISRT
jgi:hypothetical protein